MCPNDETQWKKGKGSHKFECKYKVKFSPLQHQQQPLQIVKGPINQSAFGPPETIKESR